MGKRCAASQTQSYRYSTGTQRAVRILLSAYTCGREELHLGKRATLEGACQPDFAERSRMDGKFSENDRKTGQALFAKRRRYPA